MPKLKNRMPSYRLHKATGQGVVTLDGRDIYLGRHESEVSRENYRRIIQEWLAAHRRAPISERLQPTCPRHVGRTVNELFLVFWPHVRAYYIKYGKPTSEVSSIKRALTPLLELPLLELYGRQPVDSFGPLALKAFRQRLIDSGLTRGVINNHVGRAKRFFRWAVENELLSPAVYQALQAVPGLRRGRTAAPESPRVKPVPDELIDAVLRYANRHVGAMIQLQRITGMRPGEVTIIRGCDLDMTGRIWTFTPMVHKTEHHDRERIIYLGPNAQRIIEPFLVDETNGYLFSPKRAMDEHRERVRARSKAPMSAARRMRLRKRNPKKRLGNYYPVISYEHAINRASDEAFPAPDGLTDDEQKQWRKDHRWTPNQLRHSAATYLRKEFGIEAARVILGHSSAAITEVYAEIDRQKAADIMARVG